MVYRLLLIHIQILSVFALAQTISFPGKVNRTSQHLLLGLSESLEWYDAPVMAAFLTTRYLELSDNSKIKINTPLFESKFQSTIGNNSRFTLGSIDKNTLPFAVLFARSAYIIGTDLFSEKGSTTEAYKHAILFQKSLIYTYTLTEIVKNITARQRPDKTDNKSFFSGHTSTTFTAASFLYRELDEYLNECPVTSDDKTLRTSLKAVSFLTLYGWAGFVGYSRINDNKHYLSDVIVGAAVGMFIGNFMYHSYFSEKEKKFDLGVNYIHDVPSFTLQYKF